MFNVAVEKSRAEDETLTSISEFRGDGLRDSAGRPRGEAFRGLSDCPSRLRLSGLSPLGGDALRGLGLFRGLGLRRAGEALKHICVTIKYLNQGENKRNWTFWMAKYKPY